jgi:hypothetical protein
LSAGQDEIEPLDFAPPASKHRHESKTADPISQSASPKQKTGGPGRCRCFFVTLEFVCLS